MPKYLTAFQPWQKVPEGREPPTCYGLDPGLFKQVETCSTTPYLVYLVPLPLSEVRSPANCRRQNVMIARVDLRFIKKLFSA